MVHFRWNTVTDNILCEQDDAGQVRTTYTQEPSLYGELISQRPNGNASYYHFDGHGSTRVLTDQNGNATDNATYTAFGDVVAKTGLTENPFEYTGSLGYHKDNSTDDISVRARAYKPTVHRWLSRDPMTFTAGDVNLYRYAKNSPLVRVDPSGWACQPPASVGLNYVAGRGTFPTGYPAFGDPAKPGVLPAPLGKVVVPMPGVGELAPMYMFGAWTPNPVAFLDGECCCCDEIGWAQIVNSKADFRGFVWGGLPQWYANTNGWQVDGGIPYPGGITSQPVARSADPCKSPATTIYTYDRPYLLSTPFGWVAKWEFEAEMCVVCLGGKEGPRTNEIWWPPVSPKSVQSYVAYGCIRWGFKAHRKDKNKPFAIAWTHASSGPTKEGVGWMIALAKMT